MCKNEREKDNNQLQKIESIYNAGLMVGVKIGITLCIIALISLIGIVCLILVLIR